MTNEINHPHPAWVEFLLALSDKLKNLHAKGVEGDQEILDVLKEVLEGNDRDIESQSLKGYIDNLDVNSINPFIFFAACFANLGKYKDGKFQYLKSIITKLNAKWTLWNINDQSIKDMSNECFFNPKLRFWLNYEEVEEKSDILWDLFIRACKLKKITVDIDEQFKKDIDELLKPKHWALGSFTSITYLFNPLSWIPHSSSIIDIPSSSAKKYSIHKKEIFESDEYKKLKKKLTKNGQEPFAYEMVAEFKINGENEMDIENLNAYVISPNADGSGTFEKYLPIIEKKHIALMGYGYEHNLGKTFKNMKNGDLVIIAKGANDNKQCFYAGIVQGDSYKYEENDVAVTQARSLKKFIKIDDLNNQFSKECTFGASKQPSAIYKLDKNNNADSNIIKTILKKMMEDASFENMTTNEKIKELVINNMQVILTGAPGTGKTYTAKKVAQLIADEKNIESVQFHPSFDYSDFVIGLKPKLTDSNQVSFEWKDGIFKAFCQKAIQQDNFDEEYAKFIEYMIENNNNLPLKTLHQDKPFQVRLNSNESCVAIPETETASEMILKKDDIRNYILYGEVRIWKPYITALGEYLKEKYNFSSSKNIDKKYVFIIDEINRADLSRVFGELFSCLEEDYRGSSVILPNGDKFSIPPNVYIIGTMNDIDRSVESMDFALRRRFAWHEITAKESEIIIDAKDTNDVCKITDDSIRTELKTRMTNLNKGIVKNKSFGTEYQIGGAYFLKYEKYQDKDEKDAFGQLWNNHIRVILHEYLRGRHDSEATLEEWHATYDDLKKDEAQ